jgi:hypothetical protein
VRIVQWDTLIDRGGPGGHDRYSLIWQFAEVEEQINEAVRSTVWPTGADDFTIYPESGRKRGEGNGVRPIKDGFVRTLAAMGWELEKRAPRRADAEGEKGSRPGAFDCHRGLEGDLAPFVVEWETGNISSSHRAINRMALGILLGYVSGGVLIVPSRELAQYLTDRIGNAPELAPYFVLWEQWTLAESAYLAVVTVQHDYTSVDVPRIPKGTDGRAQGQPSSYRNRTF